MTSTFETLTNSLTASQQKAFDDFLAKNPAKFFTFETLEASGIIDELSPEGYRTPRTLYNSRCISGETIFPSTEGQEVRLVYSTSSSTFQQNGQTVREAVPEAIWFEASLMGRFSVPRNSSTLLARMLFSNECQNGINPAKVEPLRGYTYHLIQPEVTAKDRAEARSFIIKVQGMINDNSDEQNVLIARRLEAVKPGLQFNYQTGPDELRTALFDAAAAYPQDVWNSTTDNTLKNRALVEQASALNFIRFIHETREWRDVTSGNTILSLPTGDAVEGLANWLMDTQGTPTRHALTKQVEGSKNQKPEKPAGPKGIKPGEGVIIPEGYVKGAFGMYYPPATDNE